LGPLRYWSPVPSPQSPVQKEEETHRRMPAALRAAPLFQFGYGVRVLFGPEHLRMVVPPWRAAPLFHVKQAPRSGGADCRQKQSPVPGLLSAGGALFHAKPY
jgi:hypothetical protein